MDNKKVRKLNLYQREGINRFRDNLVYYGWILLAVCLMCWQQPVQGVFMDDLDLLEKWHKLENFFYFVWTPGSPYLRVVSNFTLGIGLALVGAYTEYLWIWMAFVGFITATVLFHVFKAQVNSVKLAFAGTMLFVVSRFGYYAYGQYMGVMEQTATMMSVMVLYHTQCMILKEKPKKHLIWATVFSVLATLCHERYMPLFVLVILAAVLADGNNKQKIWMAALSVGGLVTVFVMRSVLLGGEAFRGTGGTSITDTFSIKQALLFLLQGCLYLFGLNTGSQHLVGFTYSDLPIWIFVVLTVFWACILLLIWWVLRNKQFLKNWKQYFLAAAFVGGTLVGGCVTFRLELRWMYTSYAGFLLILIMLIRDCQATSALKKNIVPVILFACLFVVELFYHGGYPSIYFWHPQNTFNQIYEEIIDEKDHQSLEDMEIAFVCDYANRSSHIENEELTQFFSAYALAQDHGVPEVAVYTSISDIDESNFPDVILSVDWVDDWIFDEPEVKDITEEYRQVYDKFRSAGNTIRQATQLEGFFGWEGWGREYIWTGAQASMNIVTGGTGTAHLFGKMAQYNIPNNLYIYFEDELIQTFALNTEYVDVFFELPANSEGTLRLEVDSAIAPYDVGESDDQRALGICIFDLAVE